MHRHRLLLLFYSLFCGLWFGARMFLTVPVIISFHTALNNCDAQRAESACMTSSCIWNSTVERCFFPDFAEVDCSNWTSAELCHAQESGVCTFNYFKNICHHHSGFNQAQLGLFSGCSVAGGSFASVLMQKIVEHVAASKKREHEGTSAVRGDENARVILGQIVVMIINGILVCSSAFLFTIGVVLDAAPLGLFCTSNLLASVAAFSCCFLLPSFARAVLASSSSSSSSSPNSKSVVVVGMEDVMSNDEKRAKQEVFFVRLMGVQVGVAAFLGSLWLYLTMPRGRVFDEDEKFPLRLHTFNALSYIAAALFFCFAGWTKYCANGGESTRDDRGGAVEDNVVAFTLSNMMMIHADKDDHKGDVVVELNSGLGPQTAVKNNNDDKEEELQAVLLPEQEEVADDAGDSKPTEDNSSSSISNNIQHKRSYTLHWLAGMLCPIQQQSSGLFALAAWVPVILSDVIFDSFLSQLVFASCLPLGAICGFFLTRYRRPIEIFSAAAFGCGLGILIIAISLFPSTSRDSAAPLSVLGVSFFAFCFGMGPSSLFFSVLAIDIYTPAEVRARGVAFSGSFTAFYQMAWRIIFPPLSLALSSDPREGRAIVFCGCFVVTTISGVALLLVMQKIKNDPT